MNNFLLSIVIPVYNEEKNIAPLLDRLLKVLTGFQYEIIFVDDGSTDRTIHEIKKYTQMNSSIKLLAFNRNFGHQVALTCGYQYAKGDCVISMDADLQDPPETLPEMITKWKQGAKIVYARRRRRKGDTFFKKITAKWFYTFINFLSDVPMPTEVGDFRLLDREVVTFLNTLPEHARYIRGLVVWSGYAAEYVEFDREKRHTGHTHYSLSKMINFALTGITSFSTKPLYLATYIGFFSASLGFIGIIYAILGRIFLPTYWVTGWTAIFVGIMFLGGVQLITIGIIGEYIGKIYTEVQRRPQFTLRETVNIQ